MTGGVVHKLTLGKKLLLLAVALCAVAVPVVLGQAKAAQRMMLAAASEAPKPVRAMALAAAHAMIPVIETPGTGMIAQAGPSLVLPGDTKVANDMSLGPEFEVATIRPSDPNEKDSGNSVQAGRFEGHNTTLKGLVNFAYTHWQDHAGEQVTSEGPAWTLKQHFDVEAKLSDEEMANWRTMSNYQHTEYVKPMLRRLLADRFHLRVRTEQRVTQVYALVIAKGGSKLKEVGLPPASEDLDQADFSQRVQDAMAHKAPPIPESFTMGREGWSGTSLPIGMLVNEIAVNAHLDAPLINMTGLNGYYDFTMKVDHDPDGPPLVDQVEQQLGLKAEPRKLPLTYYIIESADLPSVDGAEVAVAMAQVPAASPAGPAVGRGAVQDGTSTPTRVPMDATPAKINFDVVSIKPCPPDRFGTTKVDMPVDGDSERICPVR